MDVLHRQGEGDIIIMKVCIYLEAKAFLAKSGFKTAVQQHIDALRSIGVEVTSDPDEEYDLLHTHFFGPKTWMYLNKAKKRKIPVVCHAHSYGAHDFKDSFTFSNQFAPIYERYLRFYLNSGNLIATCSHYAQSVLQDMGVKREVCVIPNATNRDRYRFDKDSREEWRNKLGLEHFTFFSAGNIIPRKGVVDFYTIAEKLPEFDFVWYGKKWNPILTLKRSFSNRIEKQPVNVHLPGFVTDINGAFSACDSLLFTSYSENQPMAILESAAMGRVIIARDIPEYRKFLTHGEDALLANSVDEFVDHCRAVSNDIELRERLQQGALKLADRHSLKNVGSLILDIYNKLLEPKKAIKA
jgi:1,2-diacylglycerol-3-alpha-glucose alpha-1,2-glucosyltransferase